ncbi:MAG: C40 family peptidase [Porcincola intestinalis]|uniref:C40 family peptidase n=1 Tax=Porcincola intestinalis TaxID=2606632 RepID=UPI0029DD3E9F|nr:C40 family peptidase [Porcincola intestinalis]MCI6237688.1 NlpC/P60 family protein [Lachnospiraceae bacterium]MDY5332061.1 C40 family peptidase [Porcincola intestinalis]
MKRGLARATAFCLTAGLLFANSAAVYAEDTAPETEAASDVTGSLAFAECDEAYYVNVRTQPSTDNGEVIGILKNHDSAIIESVEDDGWYKIKSGDVEGYVAAWLIKTGDEAAAIAPTVAYNYAVNNAVSLNVRAQADEGADVVTSLDEGAEAEIVADEGNWFKVALDSDTYGYVSKDYVEEKTAYPTAKTIDQMMSDTEAEKQAEQAADAAGSTDASAEQGGETAATADASQTQETAAQTDTSQTQETAAQTEAPQTQETAAQTDASQTQETAPQTQETAAQTEAPQTQETAAQTEAPQTQETAAQTEAPQTEVSAPAASATGSAVVAYASQFVGNPYVWGGTSLTSGADCSGFTMAVFANFGVSLPHYAASQLSCGTQVSIDSLAPGDLVFFSSTGGEIDHVAIYVGGGSIVHAANSKSGICYSSLNWMTPVAACRVV